MEILKISKSWKEIEERVKIWKARETLTSLQLIVDANSDEKLKDAFSLIKESPLHAIGVIISCCDQWTNA